MNQLCKRLTGQSILDSSVHLSEQVSGQTRMHRGICFVFLLGCTLLCTSLSGCGKSAQRTERPSSAPDEPVNSTLNSIADQESDESDGFALRDADEILSDDPEHQRIRSQIEESARQLNVYFANMEIDGVDPEHDQEVSQWEPPTESSNQVGDADAPAESDPRSVHAARREQEDPNAVRVGLLSQSDSIGSDQPDQADQTAGESIADSTHTADHAGQPADVLDQTDDQVQDQSQAEMLDPQERKEALALELAGILRELALTSEDPGAAALALASLQSVLPDDMDELVDLGVLSKAEQTSIQAVRAFLGSLSSEGSIASPEEVAIRLADIQRDLDEWSGLQIAKAALCTQVNGYGRYETFSSYRFVAGRSQPVIVYVELDRFAQPESVGPDGLPRFSTRFSQRLELYHVADDLNTWNQAGGEVGDETRNRVRDFYLINQVTLPSNLGVGRYHLKIVVRDLNTDQIAESIIPIEFVAR